MLGGGCYVNRLMQATAVQVQSDNVGTGTIYLNMSGPKSQIYSEMY